MKMKNVIPPPRGGEAATELAVVGGQLLLGSSCRTAPPKKLSPDSCQDTETVRSPALALAIGRERKVEHLGDRHFPSLGKVHHSAHFFWKGPPTPPPPRRTMGRQGERHSRPPTGGRWFWSGSIPEMLGPGKRLFSGNFACRDPKTPWVWTWAEEITPCCFLSTNHPHSRLHRNAQWGGVYLPPCVLMKGENPRFWRIAK